MCRDHFGRQYEFYRYCKPTVNARKENIWQPRSQGSRGRKREEAGNEVKYFMSENATHFDIAFQWRTTQQNKHKYGKILPSFYVLSAWLKTQTLNNVSMVLSTRIDFLFVKFL